MKAKVGYRYGFSRYYLLTVVLSFLGWCFETVYLYIRWEKWCDCGFMTLPLCPIYGCTLMAIYLLIGTPHKPRGLFSRVSPDLLRYVLYFALAFLIPSVMEYVVGYFFDTVFHLRLWSYKGIPYNVDGYVCLPISIVWSGLIFIFMRFFFLPIKRVVGKIPKPLAIILTVLFTVAFAVDIGENVVKTM